MKKIFFLLTIIALSSCKKEAIDYAIISGRITNTEAKKITLYSSYDTNNKREISLKDDGTFLDTISIQENSLFFLVENRNRTQLFLSKENNLSINYDAQKYDSTITIEGKGKEESIYLAKKSTKTDELKQGNRKLFSKEEADFKESISTIKTAQIDVLTSVTGISKEFKAKELKNIDYEYLLALNNYENYHSYYARKEDFKASKNLLNELNNALTNFNLTNEEEFTYSSNYRDLIQAHFQKEAKILEQKDSIASDVSLLKVLSRIENEMIKNKLLFDNSQFNIIYTNNLEDFYAIFSKNSTNEKYNTIVTEKYNALKKITKGNPSPKFFNYENNAGGTTSLDDLKGKYLYIDVWATWCGPCIREIPDLKKLEKEYRNKNIEFVSISIDTEKDHDKWKKMIVDRDLKGIQLFADNNWKSKFITDYLIQGIPRFLIIDPSGTIVSSNAPRPSDKELIGVFNELKL